MAGLGLSEIDLSTLPQRRDEQESLTSAQGLGLAPTVQSAAPAAAQPAAAPEEKRGILQMLGDAGHASKGRETITARKKREALEAEAVQMERAKVGLSALSTFRELSKGMQPDQARALAQTIGGQLGAGLPGFEQIAMWSVSDPAAGKFIESLGDSGDVLLSLAGGDPMLAHELYTTKADIRELVDKRGDSRRIGRVMEKLGTAQKRLPTLPPEAVAALPRDANGRPQLTTFGLSAINRFLPEEERLTELEMETLGRNPEVAQQFGIQTPEMIAENANPDFGFSTIEEGGRKWRVQYDKKTNREISRAPAGEGGGDGLTITTENPDGTTTTVTTGKVTAGQEKEDRELENEGIAITNFARESRRLVDQIRSDPGITTSARWLVNAGGALAANADALIRDFKIDTSDLSIPNPVTGEQLSADAGLRQQFEASFPGLAGKTAAYKAAAFNLAYMAAMAKEPGARLSDKDIALNIANLGASLDDPIAAQDAIMENARFLTDAYKTKIKTKKGKDFTAADEYFREPKGNRFDAMGKPEMEAFLSSPEYKALSVAEKKKVAEKIAKEGW